MTYVDDAFDGLKGNLEITKSERATASTRQQAIRSHLDGHWSIETDFLEGSYRRDTKTKPLTDVDIFVVLSSDGDQEHFLSEHPSLILEDARRVLSLKWYGVTIDRMAAVVSYGGDVASFEVVAAFRRTEGGFLIPDTRRGIWIPTDPNVHNEISTAKNRECGGKFVPFVKMIKAINRELGELVSPSFLLEAMAWQIVTPPFGRYQDEIALFLATASDRINETWTDPAELGPDINDEMSQSSRNLAATALAEAADIATHAIWLEDEGRERPAVEEWRKLFGGKMTRP
jgi:hypothetical protein